MGDERTQSVIRIDISQERLHYQKRRDIPSRPPGFRTGRTPLRCRRPFVPRVYCDCASFCVRVDAVDGCVSKIRVLLADDHQAMLEYVGRFLSRECCDVVAMVNDGQAALEAVERLLPEVVVLDISMPILNGIEAAKRIHEACPSVKVVFLTVDKDTDTRRSALETGAFGYVLKPRLATDLVPAILAAREERRFISADLD